jgi:putative serine protease PepD
MKATDVSNGDVAIRFDVEGGPPDSGFEVGRTRLIVGSDPDCDFVLAEPDVSGEHVSLKVLGGHVEVHDLGSRTGTFVNGNRIVAPTLLEAGDELTIGSTVLKASVASHGAVPPTPAAGGAGAGIPSEPEAAPAGSRLPSRRTLTIVAAALAVVAVVAIVAAAGVFSGGGGILTEAEVIARDKPATLMVITRAKAASPMTELVGGGGNLLGGGTAWVYDASKGLIVTNAHVVVNGDTFQVGYDSTGLVHATLVGVDLPDDVAVLRVPPALISGLTTMERASGSDVRQGDTAYALGYPGNSTSELDFLKTPFQATSGTISAISGVSTTVSTDAFGNPENDNAGVLHSGLYQTDAAVNPGNSGGPLVNDRGELVGMNEAGSGSTQNQSYAIPVDKLDQVVPVLARGESIGWPGFGATALSTEAAEYLGTGLVMTAVAKDTPADQSGIREYLAAATDLGDFVIVSEVNHRRVTTAQEYVDAVKTIGSGEQATFTLAREGPDLFVHAVTEFPITFP